MKAGDAVLHAPTGETWTVAYVDGDYLAWCGWPPGEARVSDCTLVEECSEEDHIKLLKDLAECRTDRGEFDRRALRAQSRLRGLGLLPPLPPTDAAFALDATGRGWAGAIRDSSSKVNQE